MAQNPYLLTVLKHLCLLLTFLTLTNAVHAQLSVTWTGVEDNSWINANNWSPSVVPGTGDDVIIPNTTNDPIIAANVVAAVQSVDLATDATLDIASNGSLTLNGAASDGLLLNGTLNNNGILSIDNCGDNGIEVSNTGTFNNSASTLIGAGNSAIDILQNGIFSNGVIINHASGTIDIEKVGRDGIICNNTGNFTNDGDINLGHTGQAFSIGDEGIGNSGTFTNNATGTITIDNTGSDGIDNGSGGARGFFNYGTIDIGQNSSPSNVSGFGLLASIGHFRNFGGTINIDGTDAEGVFCTGRLTNTGVINIGQNTRTFASGIYNEGIINNNTCGEMRVRLTNQAPIENESGGTFNNNGLLLIDSDHANINNGAFTNNGVINYTSDNEIPNLVNNDLLITEGTSTPCIIDNVVVMGNANNYTPATNWYTDEGLSVLGAIYDAGSNTATTVVLNDIYYFEVVGNGCTFDVKAPVMESTPSAATVTWTGGVSTDWEDACNWSPSVVPTAGSDVVIPATSNQPAIGSSTAVAIKSMTIAVGASLNITSAASLNITGVNNIGLSNSGTITNNGTLEVDDCAEAIVNEGNGTLHNFGTISVGANGPLSTSGVNNEGVFTNGAGAALNVDNFTGGTGGYGLRNPGHFTNQGTINIGAISSTGENGIRNRDAGVFTNEAGGEIYIDRTTARSIYVTGGFFTNRGTIMVGAIAGTTADVVNFEYFNNEACALIHIVSNAIISDFGMLVNDGNIIENGAGDSNINANYGTIQNLNGGTFSVTNDNGSVVNQAGIVWTGCTSSDWTEASNWLEFNTPGSIDDAIIVQQDNMPFIGNGITVAVQSVEVADNAILSINSGAILNIDNAVADGMYVTGAVTNAGTVNIGLNGDISASGIAVNGSGDFSNQAGGTVNIQNTNEGINNEGNFLNAGDLFFDNAGFNAIIDYGEFNNSGLIAGNASNISLSTNLGGTLSPGFSPGRITFESSQRFVSGATMLMEVEGMGFGNADRIQAGGVINLNNVHLQVTVNYSPEDGDRIDIITASVIAGSFASTDLPPGWVLSIGPSVAIIFDVGLLPVTLEQFTAKKVDETTVLHWETSAEVNNAGFDIEHSADGLRWTPIGFVAGLGTSEEVQRYSFTHVSPIAGHNYYRLRQVDHDGTFAYSPVRAVHFAADTPKIQIYPNPTPNFARVTFSARYQLATLLVTDASGQILLQQRYPNGPTTIAVDAQSWPAGIYQLHLSVDGHTQVQQLIVTN